MAETTNLKNINFMSKERFDSLTEIDDSQLYAVEMMIDDEDLVHTTLNETIDGIKTFNSSPIVPTISDTKDSSKKVASTEFVQNIANTKQDITTAVNYDNITNCITEIPQDIKLELNNGTLILKSGSKVYVPNGTGKFDEVIVSSDIHTTTTVNAQWFVFYQNNSLQLREVSNCSSGTTQPSGDWLGFYNTSSNTVSISKEGGVFSSMCSLPIAKITISNGTITSIDQVFNGFGYIGSTIFVLPGVKGLIPNGRNADGSLKNKLVKTQNVVVFTEQDWTQHQYQFVLSDGTGLTVSADYDYNYDKENNLIKRNSGLIIDGFVISECDLNGGVISNFNSNKVFQALDSNYLSYLWSAGQTKTSYYSPSIVVEEGEGYIKFSSGVMIQWGVSIQSSRFPVIVLPQPYIDANYTACTFSNAGSGGDRATTSTYGHTTTQFQCRIQNDSAGEFRFMTIGRWK